LLELARLHGSIDFRSEVFHVVFRKPAKNSERGQQCHDDHDNRDSDVPIESLALWTVSALDKRDSKLFATVGFVLLHHFIKRITRERTGRLELPVTFRAPEALKIPGVDPLLDCVASLHCNAGVYKQDSGLKGD
jgi:hypothetical protein